MKTETTGDADSRTAPQGELQTQRENALRGVIVELTKLSAASTPPGDAKPVWSEDRATGTQNWTNGVYSILFRGGDAKPCRIVRAGSADTAERPAWEPPVEGPLPPLHVPEPPFPRAYESMLQILQLAGMKPDECLLDQALFYKGVWRADYVRHHEHQPFAMDPASPRNGASCSMDAWGLISAEVYPMDAPPATSETKVTPEQAAFAACEYVEEPEKNGLVPVFAGKRVIGFDALSFCYSPVPDGKGPPVPAWRVKFDLLENEPQPGQMRKEHSALIVIVNALNGKVLRSFTSSPPPK